MFICVGGNAKRDLIPVATALQRVMEDMLPAVQPGDWAAYFVEASPGTPRRSAENAAVARALAEHPRVKVFAFLQPRCPLEVLTHTFLYSLFTKQAEGVGSDAGCLSYVYADCKSTYKERPLVSVPAALFVQKNGWELPHAPSVLPGEKCTFVRSLPLKAWSRVAGCFQATGHIRKHTEDDVQAWKGCDQWEQVGMRQCAAAAVWGDDATFGQVVFATVHCPLVHSRQTVDFGQGFVIADGPVDSAHSPEYVESFELAHSSVHSEFAPPEGGAGSSPPSASI